MSLWRSITKPFRRSKPANMEAVLAILNNAMRLVHGSYDAAQTGGDLAKYWANADMLDADSAHSQAVRHKLIHRSRYEVANNGYADGIAQTYATDLVGVGPQLRMQTNSTGFNQLVERQWFLWSQAVQLRRKLWCMAHAKHVDGEAFAVLRRNKRINHPIKIDVVLHEADQCQSPFLMPGERGKIDGIEFDEFGNPLFYEFLLEHPGSGFSLETERVPANRVLHWYKMRRPGQHRGVPECASTLNLGAAFRRLREASLSTAEKVAAWTLLLKTLFEPEEIQGLPPLSQMDIAHGMMTALPNSFEPVQLRAEQPGPTYDTFHRSLLNEQARPKNMPYNKAACDSSSYNYASGRLDHQTYYGNLDVDREDGNDQVLETLFSAWFDASIFQFGWLGGDPELVGPAARFHLWDWPKHRVADIVSEADANRTKLESGQIFPHRMFSDAGMDWEDECEAAAVAFGVTVQELKRRIFDALMPAAPSAAPTAGDSDPVVDAMLKRLTFTPINGSGAHHG